MTDDRSSAPSRPVLADGEPSMEEILSSIRKVLIEDEENLPKTSVTARDDAQALRQDLGLNRIEPAHYPAEDDVFVLTEEMIAPEAAQASAQAFLRLSQAVDENRSQTLGQGGVTIESMAREMLRPMLKEWLDRHLHALVEDLVSREIAKITHPIEKS